MSDSDSDASIDNQILQRLTRRREKNPIRNTSNTSEENPRTTIIKKVRRKRRKDTPMRSLVEPEVEPVEPEVEPEEVLTEAEETLKVTPISNVQDQPELTLPVVTPELEDEKKLREAHTEARRLKRVQLRGEVTPSQKLKQIVKRREPKPEPEVDPVRLELGRLREEMQQLKAGFNNGNAVGAMPDNHPQQLNESQSNLLMGLMGRRF